MSLGSCFGTVGNCRGLSWFLELSRAVGNSFFRAVWDSLGFGGCRELSGTLSGVKTVGSYRVHVQGAISSTKGVGQSVYRSIGLSVCRSIGMSVCRSIGLSVYRAVGCIHEKRDGRRQGRVSN